MAYSGDILGKPYRKIAAVNLNNKLLKNNRKCPGDFQVKIAHPYISCYLAMALVGVQILYSRVPNKRGRGENNRGVGNGSIYQLSGGGLE